MKVTTQTNQSLVNSYRKIVSEQDEANSVNFAKSYLVNSMKRVLAESYVMYYAAHSSHWNVEGSNFPQYHTFFEKIYTEIYEKLDAIAEQIRSINGYAPVSLHDLISKSTLLEPSAVYAPKEMIKMLEIMNNATIYSIDSAYKLAEQAHEIGLSNFLQDLTDKHKKLGWMISATLKGE